MKNFVARRILRSVPGDVFVAREITVQAGNIRSACKQLAHLGRWDIDYDCATTSYSPQTRAYWSLARAY